MANPRDRLSLRGVAATAAALLAATTALGAPAVGAGAPLQKLRGGLERMIAEGVQPDPRLDYLVPGFRRGEFVVYVVVDRPARERVRDVRAAGARVRWVFRSVNAISAVATRDVVLSLAARPWVRSLYPVSSGLVDDTNTTISGTITRGSPPGVHPIEVPADSHSIAVDLAVTPPAQPHTDANLVDFLEARLVTPKGRTVMARPTFVSRISFRYAEEDALQAGTWNLEIWYRNANQPHAPTQFVYAGQATVGTAAPERDPSGIPEKGCATPADAAQWKAHPNLKRRGVTDIGAPVLWDAGIRGRGVRLAVLDTGVDASHVDLDDQDFEHWGDDACEPKVIANALFFGAQQVPGQGIFDVGSHGTHVAGEAAGTAEGRDDEERGAYPGVAPEASLIAGRIAIDVTALSDDMLAAAEWAIIDQRADVTNMSFGMDVRYGVLTDSNDPQAVGFEALATNPAWGNPTIMISAGNGGDLFQSIGVPAAASHLNSVAATVKDWDLALLAGEERESGTTDERGVEDAAGLVHPSIAEFSSRGPSGDFFFAPDIAAPGRGIVAPYTNQNADGRSNDYVSFSGTSMASPHAAGAAALLVDGYRQRFGNAGAFGNRPPFWLIAAALGNTAGSPAPRPAFAGGPLAKVSYSTGPDGLLQLYGEIGARENGLKPIVPVGPLVEGAGRINLPAALSALTEGVLLYTAGDPDVPATYELQPSFQAGTAKPEETVLRRLAIDPATDHAYSVSFRAASGAPSMNAGVIPPSWWTLPGTTTVTGGKTGEVQAALTVPAGTAPGVYTGYLLADATDETTGTRRTLRMPAMVVVEITDADPGEDVVEVRGFTKAEEDAILYTGVTGVASDFPMYALEVPEGLERLELRLEGDNPGDTWDLFVYDRYGRVVADTFLAVPSPAASLSLTGLAPGEYRVAVSLTQPDGGNTSADAPRGRAFRLGADLIGAASPKPAGVLGRRQTSPAPPQPLPATGVPGFLALGLLAVGAAAALGRSLARR